MEHLFLVNPAAGKEDATPAVKQFSALLSQSLGSHVRFKSPAAPVS